MGQAARLVGVMSLVVLVGCGGSVTVSHYYNPAWMADGRIIAVRDDVTTYTGFTMSAGGGSDHKKFIVVMNADGSNEHTVKSLGEFQNSPINVSPLGNFIAYNDGGDLAILDKNYNRIASIPWNSEGHNLYFFDWSPDETKIILNVDSNNFLYGRDGQKIRNLASISYIPFWKYGTNIFGYLSQGIGLFDQSGTLVASSINGPGGYLYFVDGNYYLGANMLGGVGKVRVSDFTVIETYPTLNQVLSGFTYERLQLNPVNQTELLYSKPNTRLENDPQEIWLINLDGSGQRQLRQ